jgi:hypothetical protein
MFIAMAWFRLDPTPAPQTMLPFAMPVLPAVQYAVGSMHAVLPFLSSYAYA